MVSNKIAQRAIAAGLTGVMAFGAAAPAAMAAPKGNYWLDGKGSFTIGDNSDNTTYWKRLWGSDRYGTMKAIVEAYTKYKGWYATGDKNGYANFNVAVVASGENFPDALAANGLAGSLDAPVILTKKGALSSQAKTLLDNLNVQTVFIMGGTAAISQETEDQIKALNIATVRVAGADRQATSLAAYKLIDGNWYKNSGAKDLIIATGANYADALSISPYAYRVGAPVLLTNADGTLTDDQIDAIAANKYIERVVVLGGKDAVKGSVIDAIDKNDKYGRRNFEFVRLGGDDRYETSGIIAEWEIDEWYANNAFADFNFETAYVATGENFPDALAGGQLAGGYWTDKYSPAPLLLVKDGNNTAERIIADEIDDFAIEETGCDEPYYNNYLWNNVRFDDDYYFADAWYGTANDYYVNGSIIDNNISGTTAVVGNTLVNYLNVSPIVIKPGTGGLVFRNLGNLDDEFYGYIFGGKEAVSQKKAESLDKAVKDNLDGIGVIRDEPDADGMFLTFTDEADYVGQDGIETSFMAYYKLEYDRTINGVDRWIVKIPVGKKWNRLEGVYAYANNTRDPLVGLDWTEWVIVGTDTVYNNINNTITWWDLINNNK